MKRQLWLRWSLSLLLAACAPTPTAMPTEAPIAEPSTEMVLPAVPGATLRTSDGRTQPAAIGTYCWGGVCADAIGITAPEEPLRVAADELLTMEFSAGEPSLVNLRVSEWQPNERAGRQGAVVLEDQAPLVASGDLPAARTIEWQAPSEPGEYALAVGSWYYQQSGDIFYGWHIVVE